MTLDQIKQSIRATIVDDLKNGIEQFWGLLKENSPLHQELTNHLARIIQLRKENRLGILDYGESERRENRIRLAVLESLDELRTEDLKPEETGESHTDPPTGKTGLLASMIVPQSLFEASPTLKHEKFVITGSPLSFRRAFKKGYGYDRFLKTYADYVGIRGILQAFGLLFGFDALPEILDPEDFTEEVLFSTEMNIYCIASPKANRWTGILMREFQKKWSPKLDFRSDPDLEENDLRDIRISLFQDGKPKHPDGWDLHHERDRYVQDYGIIIRGPHPIFPDKMIVILAGRSSLGTEAACRAFTDPTVIEQIHNWLQLKKIDLNDHRQAFRVLVSMKRHADEGRYPDPQLGSLRIEECAGMVEVE